MFAAVKRLPSYFGAWFGVAVAVGSMIGAGILRAPHDAAALLPSIPWFVGIWVLGGLYALLGANAIAELGAMRPRSGASMPSRNTPSGRSPDSRWAGATGCPVADPSRQ